MKEYPDGPQTTIVLKTVMGFNCFKNEEIILFRAVGHKVECLTVKEETPFRVYHSLAELEKKYCNRFFWRCNRSTIVNPMYIKNVETKVKKLHLNNETVLKVSGNFNKFLKSNSNYKNDKSTKKKLNQNCKSIIMRKFKIMRHRLRGNHINEFLKKVIRFIKTIIITFLLVLSLLMISRCESPERFYRPNIPEKLCSIGIIDVDDSILRHISFQKSFQSEYAGEIIDSLRDFSFTISSSEKELFNYYSDCAIKELKEFVIPTNIEFRTGEKYYLFARENSTSQISAITNVPRPPSDPLIVSINRGIIVTGPSVCLGSTSYKLATIGFSFANDPEQSFYYAIFTESLLIHGLSPSSDSVTIEPCSFEVKECNATGFYAELSGFTQDQLTCIDNIPVITKVPLLPYFIEGSKIPGEICTVMISTIFHDDGFIWKHRRKLKIKVLSIPKELFLFEKSLYTYGRNSKDPFSETIYLNGNIKDGNGIFAICRSSDIIINLSPSF